MSTQNLRMWASLAENHLCRYNSVKEFETSSSCIRVPSKSNDKCPHKRREGGRKCEERGRDWSQESARRGRPRVAGSHQKPAEWHRTYCPAMLQKDLPTDTWFQTAGLQNCERMKFYYVTTFVVICYSSSRELISVAMVVSYDSHEAIQLELAAVQ